MKRLYLLQHLVARDLKVRYKNSMLGFVWTLLNPLLMLVVLTMVFSHLFKFESIVNYPVFVLSVLLPWNFFSQGVVQSTNSVVSSGGLIRKIYVPKTIFPAAVVTSGLVNFLFALVPMSVLFLLLGGRATPALLFLPVSITVLFVFTLGIGMTVSAFNVLFRDTQHITEVGMSMLFYLTPIVYPLSINGKAFGPEGLRSILRFNPMVYMVESFRLPIYEGTIPSPTHFGIFLSCAILSLAAGLAVFRSLDEKMIYRL